MTVQTAFSFVFAVSFTFFLGCSKVCDADDVPPREERLKSCGPGLCEEVAVATETLPDQKWQDTPNARLLRGGRETSTSLPNLETR